MRAGKLRHRLVIEQDVGISSGSLGGRTEHWQTVIQARAKATYKSGREFERAKQIVAEVSSLFVLRYDARLEPLSELQSMRIRSLDDNTIHRILFADDPDRRRRQIHVYANEGQSA